ncbi:MAG: carbohydrate binding family 9 domain-containing protein, partial [Tannerella sp.]|nr:carbohydrate binding family 9 domain-containing protein [Tannerella sp.]
MRYLSLFILIAIYYTGHAQTDTVIPFENAYKRIYPVTKVTDGSRPVMDGRLDDEFWKQGEWTERFVQVTPYERVVSPSPTIAKVMYDNRYIYVGIYCKDAEPEKMNRFVGNRDENGVGDLFSIAFDTYHDFRAAPEFNMNSGGNRTDLIVTDKLSVNLNWNAVWEGRTHINPADSSWSAEVRIPFNQLRYNQKSDTDVWGLHIRRIIRRNNEVQNWSLIPLKNNGHVFSFGEMHGMTDLPKPRGIEFLPYVMGKYKREPEIAGSPYRKGYMWGGNAGLDMKVALSDFTLDMTVNPDFGQVEVDPSVMNLTTYETFYDEKRPFFLEGKHIMDFPMGSDMMFYTRRIGATPSLRPLEIDQINSFAETIENVPIIGALKLTGTNRQGLTLGIVQSVTARSSIKVLRHPTFDEEKEVLEPLTNFTVARVQKNWKGNTLLGGMFTSVNRTLDKPRLESSLVRNAYTAAVDFTHYFANRLYYIDMKGMFSSINGSTNAITQLQQNAVHYYQRSSAKDYLGVDKTRTSLTGTGGYLQIGRKGNAKWSFSETFNWLSPGFDLNNIGYLRQADKMSNEMEAEFRQTNPWQIFRSNTLTFTQLNQWNYGGKSFGNSFTFRWRSMYTNRFETNISQTFGWNEVQSRRLRGGPDVRFGEWYNVSATFNTDRAKRVAFTMQYTGNYNLYGDYNFNTLAPGLTLRLGNRVYLTGKFDYSWNQDKMQYVSTHYTSLAGLDQFDPIYIVGNMDQKTYGLTMKLQVNATPDISIQWYGAPFTSTAKFNGFKKAMNPESRVRSERFHTFTSNEISLADDGSYHIQTDSGGYFPIANPNFTFNEFRSNLVVRWEYHPGSTLFF